MRNAVHVASYRIAVVLLSLAASGLQAEDWPTHAHDARRTGSTSETAEPNTLHATWTWRSPHPPRPAWAGPAKYDAYRGPTPLPSMRNYDQAFHVAVAGGSVFLGSSADDSVHCLDAATGNQRWAYCTEGPVRIAPTIHDGNVYFSSDDGHAYCATADAGKLIWKFRPVEPQRLILNNGRLIPTQPCRTGVLIDSGVAYFGTGLLPWEESYLCAVDAQTGKPEGIGRFVKKFTGMTFEAPPACSSQLLIFPRGRVAPALFSRLDGNSAGTLKKSGGGSVVVVGAGSTVLHGPGAETRKGAVFATGARTGERVASHPNGRAAAVAGTTSHVLTDRQLVVFDLAGKKPLWQVPSADGSCVIVAKDAVFVGGVDQVHAYDAKSGKLIRQFRAEGTVHGLAFSDGRLFASTDAGTIHCFSSQSGKATIVAKTETSVGEQQAVERLIKRPAVVKDDALMNRWVFQQTEINAQKLQDLAGKMEVSLSDAPRWENHGDGQSLAFDGRAASAVVRSDLNQAVLPKETFTAEAWVRVDRALKWGGIIGALQDNGNYERGWLLGYRDSKFCFAVASKDGPGRLTYLTAPQGFSLGKWSHVAGVYDGREMKLYVNGKLAISSAEQQGAVDYPPRGAYVIGAYRDDNEHYRMTGALREVRVYRRALLASELS
ncbi:MAG: PQQ-binding-like beta-propeller repeat protein, partial [Planctomycetales bacterium]